LAVWGTCHGSRYEGFIATRLPHRLFGNRDCPGFLLGIPDGTQANIACNQCGALVRTLLAPELQRAIDEMEKLVDLGTLVCPHCCTANQLVGCSRTIVYTCRQCGKQVQVDSE
jgi:hypothetical protein